MEDLKKIREKITKIDNRMAELFELRMQQVAKVAEYKRQNGLPIYDPKREAEVIAKGEARVENPETSLSALGELLTPPLGKSGVNARMRKLTELARKLRAGEDTGL